jgi:hypothetical protein
MARCLSRISGLAVDRGPARFRVSFKVLYPAVPLCKKKGLGPRFQQKLIKINGDFYLRPDAAMLATAGARFIRMCLTSSAG